MKTDKFEGEFVVLRKFMHAGNIAQPGETVRLTDAFLARDLVEQGRVTCDEVTRARVRAATSITPLTSAIDARARSDGEWILPTKMSGIVRRITQFGGAK